MKSIDFNKVKPHAIAIVVFLLLTVIYFLPTLSGSSLSTHDVSQWIGMSKEILDYKAQTGKEALWTNSMFGGMPSYQISVLYPSNWVKYINDFFWLGLPSPANIVFLALLSFYILAITLKADFRIAIALAIAYAFCSFNFVSLVAGHNTKVEAIALMPMVIAGVMMTYRGKWLSGGALTALALSLEIYANHLQITYYLAIAIVLLAGFEFVNAIANKTLKNFIISSAILGGVAAIAVLPNITNLMATAEYGKYSTRGPSELTEKKSSTGLDKDYALGWSYGKMETFTLLVSNFNGGASGYKLDEKSATYEALKNNANENSARDFVKSAPLYWGDQPMTSGPVYSGAIPVFLFVLALFMVGGYMRWWIIIVALLSIMLSWGSHFLPLTDFFFDHVPGYNKFRSVSMTLVLVSLIIPLAGILGLNKLTDTSGNAKDKLKFLSWTFYVVGGLCLLMFVLPSLFGSFNGPSDEQLGQYPWLLDALRKDRESLLRIDAFKSLFFISAAFFLLWRMLNGKMKKELVFMVLAGLIVVDLWSNDKRYLNDDKFTTQSAVTNPFPKSAIDEQILQDKSYYRVYNLSVSPFNDASTSYYHKSIGGYHGAKLKRYQELIERQISKGNQRVLNMLNAKYIIFANQQTGEPMLQQNQEALGNAWFVQNWKIVPNADAEMKEMDSLDFRTTAVIDQRYAASVSGLTQNVVDSNATISLAENGYSPMQLTYNSNASVDHLAVFSEIYYPAGWNAYIDGKLTNHIRLNYVLRGLKIPAGKHKIEFKFEPKVYEQGEKMALAGSMMLLVLIGAAVIFELKKNLSDAK
ncbi:MAG: YfhO family protein [Bacteroidota bacterium]